MYIEEKRWKVQQTAPGSDYGSVQQKSDYGGDRSSGIKKI
jgi:hypothetical protein